MPATPRFMGSASSWHNVTKACDSLEPGLGYNRLLQRAMSLFHTLVVLEGIRDAGRASAIIAPLLACVAQPTNPAISNFDEHVDAARPTCGRSLSDALDLIITEYALLDATPVGFVTTTAGP
jgi:hypothetical protein